MTIPDYYGILGVPPTASQAEIKKAYQRESLRSHPDRFPDATPDEARAHTQRFQSVADAYATRRSEYDALRASEGYATSEDDASAQDESARFFRTFGGREGATEQPAAQDMFANVWEEMLRPEVEHHSTCHDLCSAFLACGRRPIRPSAGLYPGQLAWWYVRLSHPAVGGATIGHRLGAVRDAKGRSVSEVFVRMPGTQRAQILRALAVKVLGSLS